MRKFSNITGIKNICLLLGITASALFAVPSASADVIADPDYPYNASEIVTVFHDGWINGYDKINEDLRVTETAAKEEWSRNSTLPAPMELKTDTALTS